MKNRTSTTQADKSVLAVLHKSGTGWHGLIARMGAGKPAILATRDWPHTDVAGLQAWLVEHAVAQALCVVPSASIICRNTILPPSDGLQLNEALQLQAESTLLGIVPPHRLGLGVLPNAPGEMNRCGIIVGWPESSAGFAPEVGVPVQYVPDICALAALLGTHRPEQPMLWADRSDGSIAIALTSSNGVGLRATREESGSDSEWAEAIVASVAETAINANHSHEYVADIASSLRARLGSSVSQGILLAPSEILSDAATRIDSVPPEQRAWWNSYGICVGAVLARSGALESVTHLLDKAPIEIPSAVGMVTNRLRQPRYALVTVVLCLVLLGLCPLLVNGMRLLILQVRFGDLGSQVKTVDTTTGELGLYQVLERRAWPMTKLLADIANNTPPSIELSSIRLEQNSQSFALSGTVRPDGGKQPSQIVELMQSNLLSDDLFTKLTLKLGAASSANISEFDLSGSVKRPYWRPTYPIDRDFLKWSEQDRVDKKGPPTSAVLAQANTPKNAPANAPPVSPTPSDSKGTDEIHLALTPADSVEVDPATDEGDRPIRETDRPTRRTGGPGGEDSLGDRGDAITAGQEVPEAITAEQVNVMSSEMVDEHLQKVAKAKARHDLDDETKKRLSTEFRWLIDRKRAIKEGSQ